jgi:hypothetical protein
MVFVEKVHKIRASPIRIIIIVLTVAFAALSMISMGIYISVKAKMKNNGSK